MKNIIDAIATLVTQNRINLQSPQAGRNRINAVGYSNPPDMMLKNGDAIEVKKIESTDSALALNSSYPKHKLLKSNPMISTACREAEDWIEKDMLYVIGVVNGDKLKNLCMIYVEDYCASEECYSRVRQQIKIGVESIAGVEFSPTRELGRINRVDPLG